MNLEERYEILGVIARGNMGVVYRARDRRLGRSVALKQILGGESEQDRARFLREAEVVARLRHPNIVALHAYGEEGGQPWLALEYLEGETLQAHVKRVGSLSAEVVSELGVTLAGALEHAHAAGVLHRDLKPENVILSGGRPYLVDFGLARLLSRSTRLTATQDLLGTPAYMPPEQAQGEHEQVGQTSDVYGLGGTLYYAATGHAPVSGSTLLDTLQRIVSEVPAPAGSGSRQLDAALARALDKDPKQRYSSAAAFAEALGAGALGSHSGSAPPSDARARPRLVLALLASLAVVACALAALLATDPFASPPTSPLASEAAPSPSPSPEASHPIQAAVTPATALAPHWAPPRGRQLELPDLAGGPRAAALQVRELAEGLKLREAHALLAQACALWPSDLELNVWTRAWLHARLGSWGVARPALAEAARLDPQRAERVFRLPGNPALYPQGNDLRVLWKGESNSLDFEGRWTPWLGGHWRGEGEVLKANGAGFGTYNLSVALDEEAPRAPQRVEVEVRLSPTGQHGFGFAGLFLAGQSEREFFCLFLVDTPRDPFYGRFGGAAAYRRREGHLPVFARLTHQHGESWEFPLVHSAVVPQAREWLRLGVEFSGTQAVVSIEGNLVAKVELGREPLGRFGLLKFYNAPIEFRGWAIR